MGLRPTWRGEKERGLPVPQTGSLALRQGTLSPAPLFMRGFQSLGLDLFSAQLGRIKKIQGSRVFSQGVNATRVSPWRISNEGSTYNPQVGEGVRVMSQQEFFQGRQFQEQEQGRPSLEDDDIEYPPQPYYWSTQPGKGAPKDEPTSLSDDSMVEADHPGDYQHGYAAQDNVSNPVVERYITPTFIVPQEESKRGTPQWQSQTQRKQFSPDGDSFEYEYRPYRAHNQQLSEPPCARPQHRRRAGSLFWLVLLGLIFMC